MKRGNVYLLSSAVVIAFGFASSAADAQSTGGMTSSATGTSAAGGSPVGMVLPSTVQSGSTAPTQPGHTITGDRPTNPNRVSSSRPSGATGANTPKPTEVAESKR